MSLEKHIDLQLTFDEALVLWEFLSRFSSKDTLTIEHESEKRVLWDLECMLEKNVATEASQSGYEKTLDAARGKLGTRPT